MNTIDKSQLRLLRNRDNHSCFGCSPRNELGLRMEFYTDETRVYSWVTVPPHLCGWENMVHGGVIAAILDEIMSWTAMSRMKTFILTRSLTVDFIRPVLIATPIFAVGDLLEKTNDRKVLIQGEIYNSANELCARSQGILALKSMEYIQKTGGLLDT